PWKKLVMPSTAPAVRNSHPIGFSGRRDAIRTPMAGTPMLTTPSRADDALHVVTSAETTAFRSRYRNASPPIMSRIDVVPTDHAIRRLVEAVTVSPHLTRRLCAGRPRQRKRDYTTPDGAAGLPIRPARAIARRYRDGVRIRNTWPAAAQRGIEYSGAIPSLTTLTAASATRSGVSVRIR